MNGLTGWLNRRILKDDVIGALWDKVWDESKHRKFLC